MPAETSPSCSLLLLSQYVRLDTRHLVDVIKITKHLFGRQCVYMCVHMLREIDREVLF